MAQECMISDVNTGIIVWLEYSDFSRPFEEFFSHFVDFGTTLPDFDVG